MEVLVNVPVTDIEITIIIVKTLVLIIRHDYFDAQNGENL